MSNLVLLGMNRPPQAHTADLLKKLRARIPDLVLRTTFISGFPGAQACPSCSCSGAAAFCGCHAASSYGSPASTATSCMLTLCQLRHSMNSAETSLACGSGGINACTGWHMLSGRPEGAYCDAGETEEQHKELVRFCKTFKFERMGAFTYSEEDGTPAASLPDQVCFTYCGSLSETEL